MKVTIGIFLCIIVFWAQTSFAGTGEVVWMGSTIGTSGSYASNGNTISNIFDRNFNTWWDGPDASGDWAGMDAGSGNTVQVTRYRIATKPSDGAGTYSSVLTGAKIQCDSSSSFSSPITLDTIPSFPYVPDQQWTERSAAGSAYRYCRVLSAAQASAPSGAVAELQLIVAAGPTAARPVAPTIAPWGGIFSQKLIGGPATTSSITITSATGGVPIYYTIDGTTPTGSSTLYSGPIVISVNNCPSGSVTLKTIARDVSLTTPNSDVSTAVFYCGFTPNVPLRDTNGNTVSAADGSIYYEAPWYYWTGRNFNAVNKTGQPYNEIDGIWMYKSTDFQNWAPVGEILNCGGYTVCQGASILKRPSDGVYVLWANGVGPGSVAMVATSSSLTSGWVWNNTNVTVPSPGYYNYGKLYQEGSNAWAVYNGNSFCCDVYVSHLSNDYLSLGASTKITSAFQREAPVLFKYLSMYYLLTTSANNFDPSVLDVEYQSSNSLTSGWSGQTLLSSNSAAPFGISYIPGFESIPILGMTMYNPSDRRADSYVWSPLSVGGGSISFAVNPLSSYNLPNYLTPLTARAIGAGVISTTGIAVSSH